MTAVRTLLPFTSINPRAVLSEPASVSVLSTPSGEWKFGEALGRNNKELSPGTQAEIMTRLSLNSNYPMIGADT